MIGDIALVWGLFFGFFALAWLVFTRVINWPAVGSPKFPSGLLASFVYYAGGVVGLAGTVITGLLALVFTAVAVFN